jgi:hypothetical protein
MSDREKAGTGWSRRLLVGPVPPSPESIGLIGTTTAATPSWPRLEPFSRCSTTRARVPYRAAAIAVTSPMDATYGQELNLRLICHWHQLRKPINVCQARVASCRLKRVSGQERSWPEISRIRCSRYLSVLRCTDNECAAVS